MLPPSSLVPHLGGRADWSPTARIEGAQETDQAALPLPLEFLPSPLEFLPIFQIVVRISSFVVHTTLAIQLTVITMYSR